MLRGVSLIVQTTFRDGVSFDPFSFRQNRLPAPEVNISRGQVFQAFMVSLVVVVIDERLDLLFKITG
jgi:hypothetical protein